MVVEKIEHLEHLSLVLLQPLSQLLGVSVPHHSGWKVGEMVVQRHEDHLEQLAVQLGLGRLEQIVEQQMEIGLLLKLLVLLHEW